MSAETQVHIFSSADNVDLAALSLVHQRAFAGLGQEGWTAGAIGDVLLGSGGFIVASNNKEAATGFALFRQTVDEAELITLAVDPDYQRRGIAQRLLASAIKYLSERECASIFLEVRADNMPARTLYENNGFVRAGLRKNYYKTSNGERLDAVIFKLGLA